MQEFKEEKDQNEKGDNRLSDRQMQKIALSGMSLS